jgi:hypothetical protein
MADARYATPEARSRDFEGANALVAAEMKKRGTAEWIAALEKADIPVQRMNSLTDIVEDPHLAAIGYFRTVQHPSEGSIRSMAVPSEWSESAPEYRRHAPRLGEHTREVLREAGYKEEEIGRMIAGGAAIEGGNHDPRSGFSFVCSRLASAIRTRRCHVLARGAHAAGAHWKKTYPSEKILKVEQKGKLEYYAHRAPHRGPTSPGAGYGTPGDRAQRRLRTPGGAGHGRARQQDAGALRGCRAVRAHGQRLAIERRCSARRQGPDRSQGWRTCPTSAQAVAIFTEAWKKNRPDFSVEKIEVLKSEPKSNQEKRWINLQARDHGDRHRQRQPQHVREEIPLRAGRYSSVLNFQGGSWVADEKMIKDYNESGCSLAK